MVSGSWAVDGAVVADTGATVRALPDLEVWTLFGAPGPTRAIVVVLVISLLGIGLYWWDRSFVDRSVHAATERPFASLAYGLATHVAIAFAGVLLTAKLGRLTFGGFFFGWLGVLFGAGLILGTAAVGFSVVGIIVVDVLTDSDPRGGVVLGALLAGGVTLLDPLLGVATWLLVVSAGIGGYAREWVNADAMPGR